MGFVGRTHVIRRCPEMIWARLTKWTDINHLADDKPPPPPSPFTPRASNHYPL
eukprot:NODE_10226_length_244_cov_2.625641_g9485_i0.p1 GENE.NODE_10226_length_244_cov_2.625641_g9485_i0~~NODE_10226_length_244_cov_2.625641_g9485_i0.p1  ORF type:complete len:53 (+),score=6.07 NODE_10226_length_244_cov_2.625641_g9485_i0:33-191(+)